MYMEQNKVSLWLGNFASEAALDEFVRERFTVEENFYSDFAKAFEIDFIDSQFQEVYFSNNLSKDDLKLLSYTTSYLGEVNIELKDYNSVIALYDFDYAPKVRLTEHIRFIGVYNYARD